MDFLRALGGANITGQLGEVMQGLNQLEAAKAQQMNQQLMGQKLQMQQMQMKQAKEEEARLNTPLNTAALKSMFPNVSDDFLGKNIQRMTQLGLGKADPQSGDFVTSLKNVKAYGNILSQNHEMFKAFTREGLDDLNGQLGSATNKLAKLQQDPNAKPEDVQTATKEVELLRGKVSNVLQTQMSADTEYQKKYQLELGKRAADVEKWKAEQRIKVQDRAEEAQQRHLDRLAQIQAAAAARPRQEKNVWIDDPQNPGKSKLVSESVAKEMGASKAQPGSFSGDFDPKALDMAARTFIQTGQVPNLGMGGARARVQIINRAAEISDAENGPESLKTLALNRAAYNADKSELSSLQQQRGKIMAFEKTTRSNLDIAEKLSDETGRTGVPVINRWLLAGKRSVAGDPQVAQFDAAVRTSINEYAKVTSSATGGGVTSDTARREVEELLKTAQTPEQFKAVLSTLRQELDNRVKGYEDQISEIKSRMDGRNTAPAAKPKPGGGATSGTLGNGVTWSVE